MELADKGVSEYIAAPIPTNEIAKGNPVYFSYLVTNNQNFESVHDIQNTRVGYNSFDSLSGYLSLCIRMLKCGYNFDTFVNWVHTAAHSASIGMLLKGEIDVASIDYVVWDRFVLNMPEEAKTLKVLEILGPNPIQPFILNSSLPEDLKQKIKAAFEELSNDTSVLPTLKSFGYSGIAMVSLSNYDNLKRDLDDILEVLPSKTWEIN